MKDNKFLTAVALIVLGALFIVLKAGALSWAATVLGIALIVMAVMDLLAKDLVPCIIKAALGILVLCCGWLVTGIAIYVIAAILILYGLRDLFGYIKNGGKKGLIGFILTYGIAIFMVVAGVLLILNPGETLSWLFYVIGIILVVEGVLVLLGKSSAPKKSSSSKKKSSKK